MFIIPIAYLLDEMLSTPNFKWVAPEATCLSLLRTAVIPVRSSGFHSLQHLLLLDMPSEEHQIGTPLGGFAARTFRLSTRPCTQHQSLVGSRIQNFVQQTLLYEARANLLLFTERQLFYVLGYADAVHFATIMFEHMHSTESLVP
jgi:hypothetical protein